MAKNCIYCSTGIDEASVVDICQSCMYQVWGEKMAKAIVENMEKEKGNGNLELGMVGETNDLSPEVKEEMEIVDFETPPVDKLEEDHRIEEPESFEGLSLGEPSVLG
jgi:uncharacterized UBP type Zn finger protein